ncbi:MAG: RNA polymerase sigma factor [Bacteroidaceae bacterium]|nr:RNA polymerase sigma factor [Bacteroidaceae bacterium]
MNNDTFIKELQTVENAMYRYALRLTNDKENARELVQETVVRAFSRREYFIGDTDFSAWILTIMHNIFINALRRESRHIITQMQVAEHEPLIMVHDNIYCSIDEHEAIRAIRALPANLNRPLIMCVKGYNYKEIAARLNISTSVVKNRIHQARVLLRKMLKDDDL